MIETTNIYIQILRDVIKKIEKSTKCLWFKDPIQHTGQIDYQSNEYVAMYCHGSITLWNVNNTLHIRISKLNSDYDRHAWENSEPLHYYTQYDCDLSNPQSDPVDMIYQHFRKVYDLDEDAHD